MAFFLMGDSAAVGLLMQMLLLFGAAKLFAEFAQRLGQPAVVGELIAGVLIGPSVLDWVRPNEFLTVFSELGVLFLLFQVGLELKDFKLMRVGWDALLIAVAGVLLPFIVGRQIMLALGHPGLEAAFVGASMVATSVGITAKVLADLKLLNVRASKIILAAAIIDDVLGLIVLAVVSSLAKGTVNYYELGITAVLAIGFTLIVAQFGTKAFEKLVPRMDRRMSGAHNQFVLSILLLFALSVLASIAGVAAIIGAFLAGMALASSVDEHTKEQTAGVTEFLVPFFLAGIGLHMDLSVFQNPSTLWVCGLILLAAILSKFLGCGLGALRLGVRDAARVGIGMVPRGEVGMVVAQIGNSIGVIPKDVYAIVVFMSIATTMVAPPLLKLAYRDLIKQQAQEPTQSL
ncbi:cation:proton antiporter [Bryobacter aggregatus]|uniref:cation:proton antiporter n=1 Tax=Bryobacter aggregatus TaxID=360054 RepID=UPI0004E2320E|nr:cation:proton antiporter [Bryobacter aggregatus]